MTSLISQEEEVGKERQAKPLEQEPQLAARIVIEDCMCLLLDIDDIDRVWHAAGWQRDDEHLLRQRRFVILCFSRLMVTERKAARI